MGSNEKSTAGLGLELAIAQAAFEEAPDWLQDLPIENSDRIMARRMSEAAAGAADDARSIFVDATGHNHTSAGP